MSITSFSYTGSQEDRSRKTEEEKMSDVNEVGEVGGMDVVELERVLTPEAQAERDDFDAEVADRGCTCFISPPCGYCTRHWSAWSYGTMGPDDFSLVADDEGRIAEIREAVLEVVQTWRSSTSPTNAFALSFRFCPRCGKDLKDMPIHTCTPPREKGGA